TSIACGNFWSNSVILFLYDSATNFRNCHLSKVMHRLFTAPRGLRKTSSPSKCMRSTKCPNNWCLSSSSFFPDFRGRLTTLADQAEPPCARHTHWDQPTAAASWSAPVPWRFRSPRRSKAPGDWRTPKPGGNSTVHEMGWVVSLRRLLQSLEKRVGLNGK